VRVPEALPRRIAGDIDSGVSKISQARGCSGPWEEIRLTRGQSQTRLARRGDPAAHSRSELAMRSTRDGLCADGPVGGIVERDDSEPGTRPPRARRVYQR